MNSTFKLDYNEILKDFTDYCDTRDEETKVSLLLAYSLAHLAHEGHTRKAEPGNAIQPYVIHPMRVMLILAEEVGITEPAILTAALLHDVIEDGEGRVTLEMIRKHFGVAADHVKAVTKQPEMTETDHQQYYDLIINGSPEPRLVKFADRADNLRNALELKDKKFQRKQLEETRKYFQLSRNPSPYNGYEITLYMEIARLCEQLKARLA
ncbi:MAG: HD domain-containing protein [Candidatus Obscuribacterales bacterium]|nr:HD domain-containing protein [Candidatus Obscuribacterales bacterium]